METNQKTTNVEVNNENKINYQFIPVPLKLFYCCDMNCRSLLVSLVQLSTVFKSEKGWFFRTTDDLRKDSLLSENVLRASLDTLYKKNLISIIYNTSEGHFFKVNFEEFEKYENIEFDDCRNEVNRIDTEKYKNSHYSPSYCSDSDKRKERLKKKMAKSEHLLAKSEHLLAKSEHLMAGSEHHLAKSEHNIDNISNIDKSLNKNKILNRDNDLLENTKEEENLDNGIESILNEIFDDNSTNDKNTNIVTVPATLGKELIDTNEELKQIETNTSDLRVYSNEDKETIDINEKEAYKGSFEYNNELNDNFNEEKYKQMVSASQKEETSTKNNSLIETYNNNIMDTSTKKNYTNDKNTNIVTVPASQGKELNNSNEDNLNSEAVGSDLKDNSNEDKETIINSVKDVLIASNTNNKELNEYSNEEIYIKVPTKKNIKVMDNNKEDNKVTQGVTSQSATREVGNNFDSAAARPAASAEDTKIIIDTVIKMITKLKNFNTIGDFDYSAKQIYKITDTLEQSEEVINNNDIRSTVELCNNTIEVLRNDLIKEVNKKKQTKQYYY